ncbi:hypothetical protein TNCT_592491 [Trichonephila clavata]|uniref:Uncharacterized protein n=1 Tax=Trichonephila clavata TaxID=2740835 RepID=A0A8X6KYY9_TRICU|nr:hypothetical protein TNCT_592491 [Trichonephila clavata]
MRRVHSSHGVSNIYVGRHRCERVRTVDTIDVLQFIQQCSHCCASSTDALRFVQSRRHDSLSLILHRTSTLRSLPATMPIFVSTQFYVCLNPLTLSDKRHAS